MLRSLSFITKRISFIRRSVPSLKQPVHHLIAPSHPKTSHVGGFGPHMRDPLPYIQQIRTIFIQTENTPNPESIKFVPSGRIVLENEDGTGYFVQKNDPMEEILKSPLATQLFKIDGVKAVYLGSDFVTITKYAEHQW